MSRQQRPTRAALYVRVSSEEQVEGYSLDAQERAARHYAAAHEWDIVKTYPEEGKSAWTDDLAKRPQFGAMLADAEAGQFDVIIVHKIDRFARNVTVALGTLQRLHDAGIGFVSISEQMDYASPSGRMFLTMLASFAEYYSHNLSMEVRKGKAERKAQGLYNGVVPFGLKKGSGGLPLPDPETYGGLIRAFKWSAEGKSDREVADALNEAGYRTTGNRGRNPFTKDTVCRMLKNRFYLGELPDGSGGWLPGAHQAVLDPDLFAEAQRAREANQTNPAKVNSRHRRYSLSGLAVCGGCGGRLHFHTSKGGRARIYCYQARQVEKCGQPSVFLDGIDEQVAGYLATFRLPEDLAARIVTLHEQTRDDRQDAERKQRDINARLERLKRMYEWGDLTEDAYLAERQRLRVEMTALVRTADWAAVLFRAAAFLQDLPAAWAAADQDRRHALARVVFQSVEVAEGRVTAVVPQPDFAPFFNVTTFKAAPADYEEGQPIMAAPDRLDSTLAGGSDGDRLREIDAVPPPLVPFLYPERVLRARRRHGAGRYAAGTKRHTIPEERWPEVAARAEREGLRSVARDLGVSHETVRSVVQSLGRATA
ncbi:MAG: recombinase family protein [Chloroflexota bacterium]|nr:recombinase family protein [Chloroflexota bacterium]